MRARRRLLPIAVLAAVCTAPPALAHGVAGQRFFPSPLGIEEPFAQDELSLVGSHIKEPASGDEPATLATDIDAEWAKRLTGRLVLSLGGSYAHLDPGGATPSRGGFGNLELGAKYQLLTSAAHEAAVGLGLGVELGDTGDADAEADDFPTWAPTLTFAKGFGDLPEGAGALRALAVMGELGARVPTDAASVAGGEAVRHPDTLQWGVALLYGLGYLNANVRDVGLPAFARRLTPLVEVVMQSCLDRGCGGETTGFVNPGVIWRGRYLQLGLEAQVPVNDRSGKNLGLLFQIHVFIDDLLPTTLGRPLLAAH